MTKIAIITLFVVVLLAPAAPAVSVQKQTDMSSVRTMPDLSGLDFVNSFAEFPPDRTSVRTLCDVRRAAIDTAIRNVSRAIASSDESADPIAAARANNAMAFTYLYTGNLDGAIRYFEAGRRIATEHSAGYPELDVMGNLGLAALGVAHLRRGEVENCALKHNGEMCVFPLSPAARHTATSGSEAAIEYFEKYLSVQPTNLEVRWLLNVAYQTLGRYPDKVPKEYLIPPSAFESKEDVGRFVDIAPALGLDVVGNAGGALVDDFDNDGFLDVVHTGVDPCEPMHYFRSNGDGTFSDLSARSGLAEQLGGINCVQTDYNNDGWLDIYVMRGGWEWAMRNSLLRNNRDGTFSDVTAASGLLFTDHRTQSAAWADYDNDGWLDLFVGHEKTPSQLFHNRGDGTFEDVSARARVDKTAFTKGVVWGDYDDDGYPDLYVSNFLEDNFLYHNNGDGTFTDVALQLGVEKPNRSFPCWFWDYDNDARLDLFVGSYSFAGGEWVRPYLGLPPAMEPMKLYRNAGNGTFADVTKEVGLERAVAPMGSNFGDIDNDGYLDFYLGTGTPSYSALMPNLMFRNHDGKYFVDVTTSSGTGNLQKGHGVAFADLDNDGNEDVYENMGGAILGDKYNKVLLRNPGHANNWISIKLVGVKSNRAGIGAKIKLTLAGPGQTTALRYREVTSGGSFGSSPLAQHIGLGKAAKVASIEVTWPTSRTRQVFSNVAANQFLEVKELEKTYTKRRVSHFAWKLDAKPSPHVHQH